MERVLKCALTITQFREVVRYYSTTRLSAIRTASLIEQIGETLQGVKSPQQWQDNIPTAIEKWRSNGYRIMLRRNILFFLIGHSCSSVDFFRFC